jgi:hypothetical protein
MKAFECKLCGTCCYGKGGIFLEKGEAKRIAEFLGLTPDAFISRYCEKRRGRISIKSGLDDYCIFYDPKKSCLIHPVKPKTCARWPFYRALVSDPDNWEMAKDACPGINPDCSHEDFVKESKT